MNDVLVSLDLEIQTGFGVPSFRIIRSLFANFKAGMKVKARLTVKRIHVLLKRYYRSNL